MGPREEKDPVMRRREALTSGILNGAAPESFKIRNANSVAERQMIPTPVTANAGHAFPAQEPQKKPPVIDRGGRGGPEGGWALEGRKEALTSGYSMCLAGSRICGKRHAR